MSDDYADLPAPKAKAPAMPIWTCPQETPHCRHGHPMRFHREADGMSLLLSVRGHVLLVCQRCKPTTFSFGVAFTDGTEPLFTLYDISSEQYGLLKDIQCHSPTRSILRYLGYATHGLTQEYAHEQAAKQA